MPLTVADYLVLGIMLHMFLDLAVQAYVVILKKWSKKSNICHHLVLVWQERFTPAALPLQNGENSLRLLGIKQGSFQGCWISVEAEDMDFL